VQGAKILEFITQNIDNSHSPPLFADSRGIGRPPAKIFGVYNPKSCIFKALSRFLMKFKGGQKTLQEIFWSL